MIKELAKDILYNYLEEKIKDGKELPEWDEKVTTLVDEDGISTWTFRGLIKFIYELEDK
jgi:hypothetical protein